MVHEQRVVLLMSMVQFVNLLALVIVMPLGPDFAYALGIPISYLGLIGGTYTAAAAAVGFAGWFFLERFDRRATLVCSLAGLALGTAFTGMAWNLPTLLLGSAITGAFGGPTASLAISIITDVIPPKRRGRAMAGVMGALALASTVGVPIALELARIGSWRWPFFFTALLGVMMLLAITWLLPSMRKHLEASVQRSNLATLVMFTTRREVMQSYGMTAVSMASTFLLMPHISGYVLVNLRFPRADLGMLYAVAGLASLLAMLLAGRCVDRFGSLRTGTAGVVLLCTTVFLGFVLAPPPIPIWVLFALFMFAMGFRNVAFATLASKVPPSNERAQFMSLQSTIQHLASAAGALLSTLILFEAPEGMLQRMPLLATIAIGLNLFLPVLIAKIEGSIRARADH